MHKVIIAVISYLFLAQQSAAGQGIDDKARNINEKMKAEWQACSTSTDCDIIDTWCGPSVGVNILHKAEVQAELKKMEDRSQPCDYDSAPVNAAVCIRGQCVPDYTAKQH